MRIVIPARKGSKGLPFKNRKLFKFTADIIPPPYVSSTYVFSDDHSILDLSNEYGFNSIVRPKEISVDTTSTKDTIKSLIDICEFSKDDLIVMLYLTYPERTWNEVIDAIDYMKSFQAESLLCRKEMSTLSHLILLEENGSKGSQIYPHNTYRRQDSPVCFELSHYISIFKCSSINNLNHNLYDLNTVYMPISNSTIDVDTQKDLDNLYE